MKKETILISAFPGCGKSTTFMTYRDKIIVLDSDSAFFPKTNFPKNYIEHIKKQIGVADIVFISSHKEVRDALRNENIPFHIIYPSIKRKKEFLENYKNRGNGSFFIRNLNNNFERFINEIEHEEFDGVKIKLENEGDFIMNNEWFNNELNKILNKNE